MDTPLRIAFLDSWRPSAFDGSGTAVGISSLTLALRDLGHEVDLIRPSRGAGSLPWRLAFNLKLPGLLRSGASYHLVVGFDLDGFRWASAADRSSPYIVCLKGIAVDEARFSRSASERIRLSVLGWLERGNALGADRVLVPSRYSAEVARARYRISDELLRVVPEAVDLRPWEEMRSAKKAVPSAANTVERPTVLSVAHQYRRKGTATLLLAMQAVLKAHPNALLLIIGGGPELPRLRRLSRKLGLEPAVTFRGEVNEDDEVRAAFFDADLFCLPSLQEGFGIVFVEAMAAGLPIVAARSGAVPEIVEHEETGLLVPPGDARSLADALTKLLADQGARARMGAAGVRKAKAYDLELLGRRFLAATQPLLSSERQARH